MEVTHCGVLKAATRVEVTHPSVLQAATLTPHGLFRPLHYDPNRQLAALADYLAVLLESRPLRWILGQEDVLRVQPRVRSLRCSSRFVTYVTLPNRGVLATPTAPRAEVHSRSFFERRSYLSPTHRSLPATGRLVPSPW